MSSQNYGKIAKSANYADIYPKDPICRNMNKTNPSGRAAKPAVTPKKSLGQNFLADRNVVLKMIEASGLKRIDSVLEIGPGMGSLTAELAKTAKTVTAVELDHKMVDLLAETFADSPNVKIIGEDILKFNENSLVRPYKVVANLPFYLTAPAIRKFLESDNPPDSLTLIVQKEVARRIAAKPGEMSLLAVSVQFYADARVVCAVSRNCFWPVPNVDCAILKIDLKKERPDADFAFAFFKIVKAGFSQPRKQLINNFLKKLPERAGWGREELESWMNNSGLKPELRAETLTVGQWISLAKTYSIKPQKNL